MSLLAVRGISSGYGKLEVLHDVSVAVERGQLVTLLGHNGAGKSTLLKSIYGLLRPRAGEISYDGRQISGSSPESVAAQGLALVPQGVGVFSKLSVRDNLRLGFWNARGKRRGRVSDEDFAPALEHFPVLWDRLDEPAGRLSGGQRQMVSISRAVLANPSMLLLDEPSVGLAPVIVEQVLRVLRRLADDGLAIILVEQNVRQSLSVSDYTYVLKSGRVVLGSRPKELDSPERLWELF